MFKQLFQQVLEKNTKTIDNPSQHYQGKLRTITIKRKKVQKNYTERSINF